MIAYLETEATGKPATVATAEAPEGEAPVGRVTSTIGHGELFLHRKGNRNQRYG